MKKRMLPRWTAVAIGLTLALGPTFAGSNPGDLVDISLEPRGEREVTTPLAIPVFPSLRLVLDRYYIRLNLLLPRFGSGQSARELAGRGNVTPRRQYDPLGILARKATGPRHVTLSPTRN